MNKHALGTRVKSNYFTLSLPIQRKLGEVHSVFQTSFNVAVAGKLLNFSQEGMALSAYGCLLPEREMAAIIEGCKPKDLVRVHGEMVTIYTASEVFAIDLSKHQEIDLAIPKIALPKEELVQSAVFSVLSELDFENHIGLESSGPTQEVFQILQTAQEQDPIEIRSALRHLIGCGKGLTPSGDDFLIGYSMIRKALIGGNVVEDTLREVVSENSTTDISKAFYQALFDGYASSLFIALIKSVEDTDKAGISALVERIIRYGHTSGYDSLFGFYLGLQSVLP